jgi:Fur family transcriptional regulator, iron response regulator
MRSFAAIRAVSPRRRQIPGPAGEIFDVELVYTSQLTDSSRHTQDLMQRSDLLDQLKRHGVLPTPQRLEVAEVLLERPQHLSADQILERLRATGSRVSKATVYNTLKLFGERGLVKELTVDPDRKYYDSTTHAHHHFYNVGTGELSDIPEHRVRIMNLPPLPAGTEQESVEVLIRVRDRNDP